MLKFWGHNWAKVGTIYSKIGGRGELRNSKNLPRWAAEFCKRHRGIWQNLPRKTVGPSDYIVSAVMVKTFKQCLDKFWFDQDVLYNCNADLNGIGNRSIIE